MRSKKAAARAMDLDAQVARERQHRERVRRRVRAHEHERVRARGLPVLMSSRRAVVADHERDRRLVGRRHVVELLLRALDLGRVRGSGSRPGRRGRGSSRRRGPSATISPTRRARTGLAGEARARSAWAAVARHRLTTSGGKNGVAVPVQLGATADSSLQRRPHSGPENARNATSGVADPTRIADPPESAQTSALVCSASHCATARRLPVSS